MERIVLFSRCVHPSIIRITHIRIQDQRRDVSYDVLNASSLGRNFTKLTQKLCLIMFYIIAKFQENLSTQFVFKCKSGKNLAKIFQVALVQGQIMIWINIDQY